MPAWYSMFTSTKIALENHFELKRILQPRNLEGNVTTTSPWPDFPWKIIIVTKRQETSMKSFSLVPMIAPNHGGTSGLTMKPMVVLTLSSQQINAWVDLCSTNVCKELVLLFKWDRFVPWNDTKFKSRWNALCTVVAGTWLLFVKCKSSWIDGCSLILL